VRIRRIFRKITFRPPRNRNNMDLGSDLAAQILGDNEWSLVPLHVPRAMRTSLQRDFYAKHPEVLRQQISFRFRSAQQFIVSALVYQLAFRYAGGIIMNDESLLGYTDARDRNALVTFRMHINASE